MGAEWGAGRRVVLITGSGMGIGKAMALAFAAAGCRIALNGRDPAKLEAVQAQIRAMGREAMAFPADVSQWPGAEGLIQAVLAAYGRLDVLVNNAGTATRGPVEALAPEVFERVLHTNLLGSVYPSKAAIPALRASRGSVVFISSLAGLHGLPFNSIYGASKQALTAFSESLRNELHPAGIHTGIVYVGFTENDPKKVVYDTDGRPVYLPPRAGIRTQSPDAVAQSVLRLVQRRRKQAVLSPAGKALYLVQRLAPGLLDLAYRLNLDKIRAQAETPADAARIP
ncbi:MAG: SDR family oxidoreductase [Bacteroidia bacterium]|nr:SDR family oxidoreductase [Bacteroidia bacterium]